MPGFTLLGAVPEAGPSIYWLLTKGIEILQETLLKDPGGYLTRIGDVMVWQGASGQQVVAGLASVAESQSRIESAVAGIGASQAALTTGLGVVQGLSLATLGVSAFSAAAMLWRLQALDKRIRQLDRRIGNIERHLEAKDKADLQTSLSYLERFESKGDVADLRAAYENACRSANTYGNRVVDEAENEKRLPVLNYRGRCYVLSLMTELNCMIHLNHLNGAIDRVHGEKDRLTLLTEATYSETLGKAPELYLDPNLATEGVTLEVIANLYEQLRQTGVVENDLHGAAAVFEHLRTPIYRHKQSIFSRVWAPARKAKSRCLQNLRYLIACVEDVQRVESLRLLMAAATGENQFAVPELAQQIRAWSRDILKGGEGGATLAYTF